MKLSRLHVLGLYENYNYDVKFNSDVTFIFGTNGCGKTTVLNITEAIITGCLYKLFDYSFEKIVLEYLAKDEMNAITIRYIDKNSIDVLFEDKHYPVIRLDEADIDKRYAEESDFRIRNEYFERNDVLSKIHDTFNYVYLPLNRSVTYEYIDDDYRYMRRGYPRYGRVVRSVQPSHRDKALSQVENLVFDRVNRVNNQIARINDTFRNEMLRSSLDIDSDFNFKTLYSEIKKYSKEEIKRIEKSYIKILTELNIIDSEERTRYVDFFTSIVSGMEEEYKKNSDLSDLILKYNDILRIKKFLAIAEKAEKDKATARSDIELFENTINSFILDDEEGKELVIDRSGEFGFKTKHSDNLISVHSLSSGEKQLLIFFANLIFNVGKRKNGIFVVDEPELSLHLSWQKIFVEKTMKINPNIQLIFATHSPEFVGKYRDKMFKLEKHINK